MVETKYKNTETIQNNTWMNIWLKFEGKYLKSFP